MKKSYEIDMCHGPLLGKILLFSIPLMLSSILQLLFNAADIIVVGRFTGSQALAAVGSTSALINLLINIFVGLSVGVNVLVGKYYGGKQEQNISETVHTAMLTSLLSGLALVVLGIAAARPLLHLMGTPDDVLDQAILYMRIYFLGMPVLMIYNFGAAILRAVGDTRRPLYYLFAAGVVNVILNLTFVVGFGRWVDGVAWATVISEHISAFFIVRSMMKAPGALKLELRKLRIVPDKLRRIVKVGLPAGIQGAVFSVSNVVIQSSVNSFGSVAMAGNTASSNIEGFVYTCMNAVYQTALSFTSQNYGAKNYLRVKKALDIAIIASEVVSILAFLLFQFSPMTVVSLFGSEEGLYNEFAVMAFRIFLLLCPLTGFQTVIAVYLQAVGKPLKSAILSVASDHFLHPGGASAADGSRRNGRAVDGSRRRRPCLSPVRGVPAV